MPLLESDRLIEDRWQRVTGEEPLPEDGRVIVTLSHLQGAEASELPRPLGVVLAPDEPVEALEPWLDGLALVALVFPKFNDGRAFSQAAILRERYGFKGRVRATGEVLVDQYPFMRRVGFDSFEIADSHLESWRRAEVMIALAYQDDPADSAVRSVWQMRHRMRGRLDHAA